MKKNLILFNLILLFFLLSVITYNFFIPNSHKKNLLQENNSITQKNKSVVSISKEQSSDKNFWNSSSEIPLFQENETEENGKFLKEAIDLSKSEENEKKTDNELQKAKFFKTAEEVIDTLFPNLKSDFGEEKYEELITTFPYGSLKDISGGLTPDQLEKYKELLLERKVDADMQIPDYKYTTEEIFKIRNKLNRIYIPKFINILTEKQQQEFVNLVKETREF